MRIIPRLLPCVWIALSGCSGIHQHYYFRSTDRLGQPVDYYRVDVDGGSILSSSRYLAGYFDESAVNAYFDELSQPANASLSNDQASTAVATPNGGNAGSTSTPGGSASTSTAATGTTASEGNVKTPPATVTPLSVGKKGILVLLLSSNSDEIADGISSLANNQDVTNSLVAMVQHQQQAEASKTQAAQQTAAGSASALQSLGDSSISTLDPASATADKIYPNVLTYANALAAFLEPGQHFANLAEAKAWLDKNASKLAGQ